MQWCWIQAWNTHDLWETWWEGAYLCIFPKKEPVKQQSFLVNQITNLQI